MNTWLRDHLVRAGHMTETGATRRARIKRCPRCRELVVVGLDGVMCALEVHADPVPLSPLGEALSLATGRRTVALHREGGRYVIDPRTDTDITHHPAGAGEREDVLRSHVCADNDMPAALSARTSFAEVRPPVPANSEPPF